MFLGTHKVGDYYTAELHADVDHEKNRIGNLLITVDRCAYCNQPHSKLPVMKSVNARERAYLAYRCPDRSMDSIFPFGQFITHPPDTIDIEFFEQCERYFK